MLALSLTCLSIFLLCLCFRPHRKDFIQIGLAALASMLLMLCAAPIISVLYFATQYKTQSATINTSHDRVMDNLEVCEITEPKSSRISPGCGGGCVSDGRYQHFEVCEYNRQQDCIGTIKQKIQRYSVSSSRSDYIYEQNDDILEHPEFPWPLKGKIIQAFSTGQNNGINISVPEGTQVRAVESGEVAYASNELGNYGDMILIRHPNGFVSAYANNSQLLVGKGDRVERGQVIAKSGKSGNAGSPQLHFELRRRSTPVDPTEYLKRT